MTSLGSLLDEGLGLILQEFHIVDFAVQFARILTDECLAFPFLGSSETGIHSTRAQGSPAPLELGPRGRSSRIAY